ncbi:MAG: hypothetical protein GKR94_11330 [Gammaproteobacteria bacterium]|nr:hypothetical protein [Gammaproteobacteria bacterium]
MRNQIAAAERMGVRAVRITSDNREHWEAAEEALRQDQVDILLIAPERLGHERFLGEVLADSAGRIGLLVIEAAVAEQLGVTKPQARDWLKRLVQDGTLVKLSRPVRYSAQAADRTLFDDLE